MIVPSHWAISGGQEEGEGIDTGAASPEDYNSFNNYFDNEFDNGTVQPVRIIIIFSTIMSTIIIVW